MSEVKKIIDNQLSIINTRSGAALLVVLFIVMAITILALGFLSQSDVELACGQNMLLRTQMDYLAESALEHARGLILNPQDIESEYWTGGLSQQLVTGGDDYYDVNVVKIGQCNYRITSDAYREKMGERIGRSSLEAELRLDPCIAFWAGSTWTSEQQITINGDVYCDGTLGGNGNLLGDAFASGGITASVTGRKNEAVAEAPVAWPGLNIDNFSSSYYIESTGYSVQSIEPNLSGVSLEPGGGNPAGVRYCNGDVELQGGVNITGMLVVGGDVVITGASNTITAVKNFPALLVSGEVVVGDGGMLEVNGLAQISQRIVVAAGAENVDIDVVGGLFIANGNIDGLNGSSLSNSVTITAAPNKAAIEIWPTPGNPMRWSPAAGAFFRSIERK